MWSGVRSLNTWCISTADDLKERKSKGNRLEETKKSTAWALNSQRT